MRASSRLPRLSLPLVLALVLALAGQAWGAVGGGAFGQTTSSTSPVAVSITVDASATVVVVMWSYQASDTTPVTSISGAGATWQSTATFSSNDTGSNANFKTEVWYGTTPTSGAQTVSVSFSGTSNRAALASAWSFTGASTTTPLAGYQHGTSATLNIVTTNGDAAISGNFQDRTSTLSGCGTTVDFDAAPFWEYLGAHCLATGATTTFTWATVAAVTVGFAVKQTSAARGLFLGAEPVTGTGIGGAFFRTRPD